MSNSTKVLWLIVLTLSCAIAGFTQNRIAFVDKNTFADEKTGIKELVIAYKQLEVEIKPKIEKLNYDQKVFEEYILNCSKSGHCPEFEKRIAEQEKKNKEVLENIKIYFNNRESELIIPIKRRINEKLKEFAKQNDYEKIFDLSENELEDSALLYSDDPIDVTEEFIKFYNEEFEKEKIQK